MAKRTQENSAEYRRRRAMKRRRKRVKRLIAFLKLAVVICAVYGIVFHTPLFYVSNVKTTGNSQVEDKEIISASGIKKGQHFFKIKYGKAEKEIEKIPYVDEADVKYKFPRTLEIRIKESENAITVKSGKKFIFIDKNLKVLKIADKKGDLPVVEGFSVKKNQIGSKITIDESQKFDIILLYREILIEKNLYGDIDKFIVDENGLTLVTDGGIKIICGTTEQAEYKISAYLESRRSQPDITVGTFDVTVPSRIVYRAN